MVVRARVHLMWCLVLLLGALVSAQTQAPPAQGAPLTNEDVVNMVKAKLSLSIITTTIRSAGAIKFDVSPAGLVALKNAGVPDSIVETMIAATQSGRQGEAANAGARVAPEKSALLSASRDPKTILQAIRTIWVDASKAKYFGSDQLKGALGTNKDFAALGISIVEDRSVADAVLVVGYTFAWDYPFTLKYQNTSLVLVSGKGYGPFSGPLGAESVAAELTKLLKLYRTKAPATESQ